MEKIHLEQAKIWFEHARGILKEESGISYAVGVAMTIHAIIKANDALIFKFLNVLPKKHDDAKRLFKDLVDEKKVDPKYANYADIVQEAITLKARAEYSGKYFSKNDLENITKKAERFIKMVSGVLK